MEIRWDWIVEHLDDIALSARAAAGEAELRKAPIAPSRRRSLKVTVT